MFQQVERIAIKERRESLMKLDQAQKFLEQCTSDDRPDFVLIDVLEAHVCVTTHTGSEFVSAIGTVGERLCHLRGERWCYESVQTSFRYALVFPTVEDWLDGIEGKLIIGAAGSNAKYRAT